MNIDDFANEFFEGDIEKSLEQLAFEGYNRKYIYTKNKNNWKKIGESLSDTQEMRYVDYLVKETNKNPTNFLKGLQKASVLLETELTYDEIKNAKVNPYKAKIGKSFFKFLVGTGGILAFMVLANNLGQGDLATKLGTGAMTLFNSYVALDTTSNIMKYFKFKNARKEILSDELNSKEIEKGGKRL